MTVRESVVEMYLVRGVKDRGGLALKLKSPQRRGAPDRLVLLPGGRVIFVELKAPGETPEDHQLREHERLRALGFNVVVLDSLGAVDDWERTL